MITTRKRAAAFAAIMAAATMTMSVAPAAHGQGGSPLYSDNVTYAAGVNVEPGRAVAVNGSPVTSSLFTPPSVTPGDTVRVAWDVSVRGVESSNHIQTSRGFMVSLPENYTENVSFTYTGLPNADRSGSRVIPEQRAVAGDHAIIPSGQEYDDGSRDFVYQDMGTEDQGFNTSRPFTPLHFYDLDGSVGGVTTFRIEADVDTSVFPDGQVPADFYIPVRVENTWRCFDEGGGSGSYDDGCQSLLEYRATASTGLYDPVAEDGTPYITTDDFDIHGLYGDTKCSVTHETGDPFRIGTDTDAGPNSFSYVNTFRLYDNPAVQYIGPNDDLCDRHVAPIRFADPVDPTDPDDDQDSGSLEGGSLGDLGSSSSEGSLGSTGGGDGDGTSAGSSGSAGSLSTLILGSVGSTGSGDNNDDGTPSGSLGSLSNFGSTSGSDGDATSAGSLGSVGSTGSGDDNDDGTTSGSLGSVGSTGGGDGDGTSAGSSGSVGSTSGDDGDQTTGSLGSTGSADSTGSLTLTPQCVLTGSAIILPLLALGPIAQAAPHIPGIAEAQAQIDQFLAQSHTDIQKRLGIYDEDTARRIAEINAQLGAIGADLQGPATAIGGTALALLAVGSLANNCIA